jgi:trimeric autotransporter adhesin
MFEDASSNLTIDAPLELPDVSFDMAPEDPFSIEVATLLPPSEAMHGGSDVTVRLADGRSLPGWVHYDAAKGVLRGKLPPGVEDVHIVVRTRDASGHETRREVVLAPHDKHGRSHGASHHVTHPKPAGHAERALAEPTVARAARPVGKPSLDQQFAQARAALHVSHPGDARRRV